MPAKPSTTFAGYATFARPCWAFFFLYPPFTSLATPFTSTNHFHLLLAAAFPKIFLFSTITWSNIRKSPYLIGFVIFHELAD